MSLVCYSDSEEESEMRTSNSIRDQMSRKSKRDNIKQPTSKPPPLPQSFHSLYTASRRTHPSDDPALHGGRTRQVPHTEGNWPTHIYLEWYPQRDLLEELQGIIDSKRVDGGVPVHSLLQSELGVQLPLHISLSAPLVLRTEQKSEFMDDIGKAIKWSGVSRFELSIRGVRWERNFDGSRWFLVLRVSKPDDDELNKLLACCNKCASRFKITLLYENGIDPANEETSGTSAISDRSDAFHISIAWQLGAPSLEQRTMTTRPDVMDLQGDRLIFDVVKLKIGNVVRDIALGKPT